MRVPANLFNLTGGGIHVAYSATDMAGKPSVSYQDATRTLTFQGEELRTVVSDLGLSISVSLQRTVDFGYTSFSVLIPAVELETGEPAHVDTYGITTLHRTSRLPFSGQLDSYHLVSLTGTATAVQS